MHALHMLGEIKLVQRRIRTQLALELGLWSHLLEFTIDERPILHVVFECGLGFVLAQHHESVHIELGMKRAYVSAHIGQAIRTRSTMRAQVGLPAVAH